MIIFCPYMIISPIRRSMLFVISRSRMDIYFFLQTILCTVKGSVAICIFEIDIICVIVWLIIVLSHNITTPRCKISN